MKKYTSQNTTQATGYTDWHVRECPRCHGDGLTRINQTNNPNHSGEAECMLCSGHGIITVEE